MSHQSNSSEKVQVPSDKFFDGGWCWMTHPDWNGGNAIPVKMVMEGGTRFYLPFEPHGATDFEWDKRDPEWEIVEPATAQADAEFDAYCARVAGGHLASLVDELRAEKADLLAALSTLVQLDDAERASGVVMYAKGSPVWKAWKAARTAIQRATT